MRVASSACPRSKRSGATAVSLPVSRSDSRMLRRSSSPRGPIFSSGNFRHTAAAQEYCYRFWYCSDAFLEFISTSEHRQGNRMDEIDTDFPQGKDYSVNERFKIREIPELQRLDPHSASPVKRGRHTDKAFCICCDGFVGKSRTGQETFL